MIATITLLLQNPVFLCRHGCVIAGKDLEEVIATSACPPEMRLVACRTHGETQALGLRDAVGLKVKETHGARVEDA